MDPVILWNEIKINLIRVKYNSMQFMIMSSHQQQHLASSPDCGLDYSKICRDWVVISTSPPLVLWRSQARTWLSFMILQFWLQIYAACVWSIHDVSVDGNGCNVYFPRNKKSGSNNYLISFCSVTKKWD